MPDAHSKATIVTASSGAFFHYLQGMVLSVREKPEGKNMAIGVFDLGLEEPHKAWLESENCSVVTPEWEFGLDETRGLPVPFKGILARPHYPKYFPGYDIYMHIDSDAWVQNWWAVDLYLRGASRGVLAITPEIERSFISNYGTSKAYRDFVIQIYTELLGPEVAETYRDYPIMNSGIFAMPVGSPLWSAWQASIRAALDRGINFHVEQASLNYEVFSKLDTYREQGLEFLPAVCNWVCHQSLPMFDKASGQIVEPFLPHHPIGMIHRSTDDFKIHKSASIRTTDGGEVEMSLKYREGQFGPGSVSAEPEKLERWQDENLEWMTD